MPGNASRIGRNPTLVRHQPDQIPLPPRPFGIKTDQHPRIPSREQPITPQTLLPRGRHGPGQTSGQQMRTQRTGAQHEAMVADRPGESTGTGKHRTVGVTRAADRPSPETRRTTTATTNLATRPTQGRGDQRPTRRVRGPDKRRQPHPPRGAGNCATSHDEPAAADGHARHIRRHRRSSPAHGTAAQAQRSVTPTTPATETPPAESPAPPGPAGPQGRTPPPTRPGHRPPPVSHPRRRQLPRPGEHFLPPPLGNHRLRLHRPPRSDPHQVRPGPRYDVHHRVPAPPSAIHRPSAYSCASS